ncbi:hypothetical protein SSBR45G_49680 [Bradyrhizobium sp. SSBR45G]|nr:hypothetical protein SSBR45G_49680 [Bradyrhizobium sp. SSBR45G]GLH87632.1 hypothetical protein SSBR45R_50920 [Bradyrhizobium sp. SSBR45R]
MDWQRALGTHLIPAKSHRLTHFHRLGREEILGGTGAVDRGTMLVSGGHGRRLDEKLRALSGPNRPVVEFLRPRQRAPTPA